MSQLCNKSVRTQKIRPFGAPFVTAFHLICGRIVVLFYPNASTGFSYRLQMVSVATRARTGSKRAENINHIPANGKALREGVLLELSAKRISHLQNNLGEKSGSNSNSPAGTVNSRRAKRTGKKNHERYHHGVRYASASEAACGELMEKYIPNFKVIPLKTFQIPAFDNMNGSVKTIDFRVGDTLVEYHPARMWQLGRSIGEFETRKEYGEFRKELNAAKRESKEAANKVRAKWEKMLTKRYTKRREALITESPELSKLKLIVAASAEDLYDKVIKPLGKNIPSKKEFVSEFHTLKREVFDNNQDPDLQEPHLPGANEPALRLVDEELDEAA